MGKVIGGEISSQGAVSYRDRLKSRAERVFSSQEQGGPKISVKFFSPHIPRIKNQRGFSPSFKTQMLLFLSYSNGDLRIKKIYERFHQDRKHPKTCLRVKPRV